MFSPLWTGPKPGLQRASNARRAANASPNWRIAGWGGVGYRGGVNEAEFADATLVLVGHGSTLNAESGAPTYQHAEELRRRGLFADVIECFWKLEPPICGVLRGVWKPRVFVVPVFISEGYFTEEVIPRELGMPAGTERVGPARVRVWTDGDRRVHYCGPVGTHESMTAVLLARARDVVAASASADAGVPEPRDVSLFIAGHGTSANENSRVAIERQVERIRARGEYACVHPIFMEEEPRIERCYELATTESVVIVPFFISDGLHSYEDIPVMLGESRAEVEARYRAGRPTWNNPTRRQDRCAWYAASIGNEPHLADVIVERAREAATASRALSNV